MTTTIAASQLQPGDVLLYHGDSFLSKLIRRFDGGLYSHASIFDGSSIMEALGDGIEVNPVARSIARVPYVDVYRFTSQRGAHLGDPGLPIAPLKVAITAFEQHPQRYAYEEIVLLALLTSARKAALPPGLALVVRDLLDSAADVVADIVAAGRQPVICSELVYRCYLNAGGPYQILVLGADIVASNAVPAAFVQSSEDDEVRIAARRFLTRYAISTGRGPSQTVQMMSGVATIGGVVADFVTPRDLESSPSLRLVGRLQLGSSPSSTTVSMMATASVTPSAASALPGALPEAMRGMAFALSETLPLAPITPANYCTSANGIFDDTTAQQMHAAVQDYGRICASRPLALFFHGGLVDRSSGLESARQLIGPYSDATGGNAYPYFFVWESGLLETLKQNLPLIVKEVIFERISNIVEAKARSILQRRPVSAADAIEPSMPVVADEDLEEVHRAVENDPFIRAESRRIARTHGAMQLAGAAAGAAGAILTSSNTLLSPHIVAAIVAEESGRDSAAGVKAEFSFNPVSLGSLALRAGKVLIGIVQRYRRGRNHSFHNTLVEEILRQFYLANVGGAVWNAMKLATAHGCEGDGQNHVGAAMAGELVQLFDANPAARTARIALLGHSAGAIYICNFLSAMATALKGKSYANQVQFDVVFMAPAVRADFFAATLQSHGTLIRNFRVFELDDPIEQDDALVQIANGDAAVNELLKQLYTSSLLYFIAGVLEDDDDDTPIDGMQRYFMDLPAFAPGKFAFLDAVRAFYARHAGAVVTSDTGSTNPQPPIGRRCTAHHHGGFPVDPATLESVCYLLRTGDYS